MSKKSSTEETIWDTSPISFDAPTLSPFPCNIFPDWLRQFVHNAADATQTPVDASGMAALSVLSTALAKKFIVKPYSDKSEWTESNNIYNVCVMPSGERKSTVNSLFIKPIVAVEKEIVTDALQQKSESPVKVTRYIVDDVTPEKLIGLLKENDERLAILSCEGGLFEALNGQRYSNTPNLDVYLKSYTGSYLTVDRVNRPTEILRQPILTIGLFVQPTVLQGLPDRLADRGIFGRFLYSLPSSLRGKRDVSPRRIEPEIERQYMEAVQFMLKFETDDALCLHLSEEAQELFLEYCRRHEDRLNGDLSMEFIQSWAERLPAHLLRITSLIYVAEQYSMGMVSLHQINQSIGRDTLQRVLDSASYFIDHALAAFGCIKSDEGLENAKYVLNILLQGKSNNYIKQDLWKRTKGKFNRSEQLDAALAVLEDRGYIKLEVDRNPSRVGRKPLVITINPNVLRVTNEKLIVDSKAKKPTKRKLKGAS